MTAPAALTLAHAAAQTSWPDLPESAKQQSCDIFTDTVAVCAAGLSHPTYASFVAGQCGEPGVASIPGISAGVPVQTAVQVNGGATTVLQLQDGHRMGRGHPASHIVPVLLALAEESNANAEAMLAALVAGYEVGARIGIAMNGLNPMLHDTGTWSTIGATVAAAHLLSHGDEEVMASAIEAAAAIALMPYRDLPLEGASAHHLYIGLGATGGLTAARAALAGMSPLPRTLETFFGPRAGADFDATLLTAGIDGNGQWATHEIENAYFKVHPTCAHLHGANDAVVALIERHVLTPENIEAVEVATYSAGMAFDNETPENALAARFSLSATTAIALCTGALNETTLTDDTLKSSAVQNMMKRITVVHDPALDAHYPEGRPARVTVTRGDGSVVSESVTFPSGDHTNPLSSADKRGKADRLLAIRFNNSDTETVLTALDGYFTGAPIGNVTTALRRPARS